MKASFSCVPGFVGWWNIERLGGSAVTTTDETVFGWVSSHDMFHSDLGRENKAPATRFYPGYTNSATNTVPLSGSIALVPSIISVRYV